MHVKYESTEKQSIKQTKKQKNKNNNKKKKTKKAGLIMCTRRKKHLRFLKHALNPKLFIFERNHVVQ